jgi:hypothetical protein
LADRSQFSNTRIDEENIQLSEPLSAFLGNGPLIRRISRVGLDDNHIGQLFASRIDASRAETSDRDSRAFFYESAGRFESDAAGSARDQSTFSLESCHV